MRSRCRGQYDWKEEGKIPLVDEGSSPSLSLPGAGPPDISDMTRQLD